MIHDHVTNASVKFISLFSFGAITWRQFFPTAYLPALDRLPSSSCSSSMPPFISVYLYVHSTQPPRRLSPLSCYYSQASLCLHQLFILVHCYDIYSELSLD
ncbi:hypothetical protein BDN72DRAFT_851844 [Pluteus cervinus]|uniref:Uncharacterized protein n=1 Tax=Pluteus cervinus TaxID=181527 RepID=A0ACD2ZZR3_9AGAR|nr:hypothetical protein BDN72DRAFT_851844 [Pluteus cervinus]